MPEKPEGFKDPANGPYGEWLEHEAEEDRRDRFRRGDRRRGTVAKVQYLPAVKKDEETK
jgi:hypothetical protein